MTTLLMQETIPNDVMADMSNDTQILRKITEPYRDRLILLII